jgi:hypothetical protein
MQTSTVRLVPMCHFPEHDCVFQFIWQCQSCSVWPNLFWNLYGVTPYGTKWHMLIYHDHSNTKTRNLKSNLSLSISDHMYKTHHTQSDLDMRLLIRPIWVFHHYWSLMYHGKLKLRKNNLSNMGDFYNSCEIYTHVKGFRIVPYRADSTVCKSEKH